MTISQAKNTQSLPPSLINAFTSGFDSVANHIYLLIFPLVFDLLPWLGPHLRLSNLIRSMLTTMDVVGAEAGYNNSADMKEMMQMTRQMWELIAERFNLFTALRTYPVGVPSLMAARLPIQSPLGMSNGIEVDFIRLLGLGLLFTVVGLFFGTFYFALTAQVTLNAKQTWLQELQDLPRAFVQVIWLTIFLIVFLFVLSIPVILVFSLIMWVAGSVGQWVILLLSGALLWLLVPLLFSPHGIFLHRTGMLPSLLRGIRLVQFTLPKTSLFILAGFVLMQGLKVVWQIPPENSWLSIIGILGHGFVYTGLLASSFVYYRQAEEWLQYLANQRKVAQAQTPMGNQS